MFASVNSGRPPLTGGCEDVIVAPFAESAIVIAAFSTTGATAMVLASTDFGRTVIIAVGVLTAECTVVEPPKTNWVELRSAATSWASVMIPLLVATATRAEISLPIA
ncbi:unannotated protein [freshwater metagenome]|uniref:Unannotated protein n=1 Tax=freshwater metagenome TaxID=449393 RepID=A0A6J6Z512_9ZZZZ